MNVCFTCLLAFGKDSPCCKIDRKYCCMHSAPVISGKGEGACEIAFDLIGCYAENSPGVALYNDRQNVNWDDITSYMKGYHFFYLFNHYLLL